MPIEVQRRAQLATHRRGGPLSPAQGFAVCLLLLFLVACTPDDTTQMEDPIPGALTHPLPPCPGTPNCVLATRLFEITPDVLFQHANQTLQQMGASQIEVDTATRRLDAVFPVFLFKDDVAVVIAPHSSGSTLHIRSASRVGAYDFGVNRRRVQRFFKTLETQ